MRKDSGLLLRRPAACAWLVLIAIIAVIAGIGFTTQHGATAGAILASIAALLGLWTALATLTSENRKTNSVLVATAALCACLGLLASQAATIRQISADADAETVLLFAALAVTALLIYFVYRYNREDDES